MIGPRRVWRALCTTLVVIALVGCNMPSGDFVPPSPATRTPLPTPVVSITPSPLPPTPTPTSDWETVLPGLELQVRPMEVKGLDAPVEVTLVRLDPTLFAMRVHYAPTNKATVSEWQQRTGALMVVNGGYYYRNGQTLGLLFADGQKFGTSFNRNGGMLSVSGGAVSIRSLAQFPYQGEIFDQAVQGRPMVLYPGGFPVQFDDVPADLSRRTVVAQDTQGRIVFIVVDEGVASLYALRDWMVDQTDLGLFVAFNLDGGLSTGLVLNAGERSLFIESRAKIPIVIAIYSKP